MRTQQELEEIIEDKFGLDAFFDLIYDEVDYEEFADFSNKTNLDFDMVSIDCEGNDCCYTFKLDGQLFQTSKTYNSWDGTENQYDLYPVKPIQVTKYVPLNEEYE